MWLYLSCGSGFYFCVHGYFVQCGFTLDAVLLSKITGQNNEGRKKEVYIHEAARLCIVVKYSWTKQRRMQK